MRANGLLFFIVLDFNTSKDRLNTYGAERNEWIVICSLLNSHGSTCWLNTKGTDKHQWVVICSLLNSHSPTFSCIRIYIAERNQWVVICSLLDSHCPECWLYGAGKHREGAEHNQFCEPARGVEESQGPLGPQGPGPTSDEDLEHHHNDGEDKHRESATQGP